MLIGVWNVHSLFCNRVGYLSKWYALFIDQLNSVYFHCVIIKLIELNDKDREEIANEYAESPNQDRMEDIYDEIELETD